MQSFTGLFVFILVTYGSAGYVNNDLAALTMYPQN